MNLGVIGNGIVGSAVSEGFKQKGFAVLVNDYVESKSRNKLNELAERCDIVFICVNTPTVDGEINLISVLSVVSQLRIFGYKKIVVIKSTVVPGTTDWFQAEYPEMQFACNPEFMRAESALKDFLEPDRIIIGCWTPEVKDILSTVYSTWHPLPFFVSPLEAELIKYFSNLFLVYKVAYSMEAARICDWLKLPPENCEQVLSIVGLDNRIGQSHLNPALGPIPKDSLCLPKDLQAFIHILDSRGYDTWFLRAVQHRGIAK